MKTIWTTLTISLFLPLIAIAQPHGEQGERLSAMKVAFITERVGFTTEEAQAFWPIHNEMEAEMSQIRTERHELIHNARTNESLEELTEEELLENMNKMMELDQRELNIKKKYHKKFLEVLPAVKVAKLYRAEEQFKRELLRRFSRRGENHERPEGER